MKKKKLQRDSIRLSDFVRLLARLDSNVEAMFKGRIPIGSIADSVALTLWVNQRPEDADTRELRYQIEFSQKHAKFDFSELDHENIPYKPTFTARFSRG